jgi:ketosteroid isomerase-like protein
MDNNLNKAQHYLTALERGVGRDELAQFFTADVQQEEFPNRLTPNGATRDLSALLNGNERGKKLMTSQRYEITNALESGDQVVLEVHWTGTLAQDVGTVPAGGQMQAHFAVFLQFREGKIAAQRNYDCFDPW